jgi:superfamily II DNA or RNA helicase
MSLEHNKKTLLLFKTVQAGEAFCSYYMSNYSEKFSPASSKFKAPFYEFCKGQSNLLVSNAPLLGEGVDIPFIDVVIDATCSSSEGNIRQIIGRGLRQAEGKQRLIYFSVIPDGYGQFESAIKKRQGIYESITDNVTYKKIAKD